MERNVCSGTIITNYNVHSGIILKKGKPHSHESDEIDIQVHEVVRTIKRKAREMPNAPPSSIFRDEMATVSNEEVLANLPQRNDIIRTINRVQNRMRPQIPNSLEDLHIVSPYTMTISGDQFLQYDSGADNNDRFIMFYTRDGLEKLCNSRMILCDGTFKTAPSLFYQLYSIHGIVNNYTFPLIYVLATRKDQAFYTNMLTQLKSHAEDIFNNLNPQYISADFEIPFINAARTVFPDSTLHGCLFHYTQSIWRNAVNRGLKVPFKEVNQVRSTIQCLLALPLIPLQDIEWTFDLIVINAPQIDDIEDVPENIVNNLMDLLNFVDRVYLRGTPARGRRRAVLPRFPLLLWNVHEIVLNRQQRSTNTVEGWHSRFAHMIVSYHSGVWKFLDNLKKDQNDNQTMMIQLSAGHTRVRHPIKASIRRNQEMIERIVENYQTYKDDDNVLTYLKAIGYKLKLKAQEPEANPEANPEAGPEAEPN